MDADREAKLKELLGADYEAYVEFQAREAAKALKAKAKELATAMVSKGGKYAAKWDELNAQMDAIWEKATSEANKQVGIVETPKE